MIAAPETSDRSAALAMLNHAFCHVGDRALKNVDPADVIQAFAQYREQLAGNTQADRLARAASAAACNAAADLAVHADEGMACRSIGDDTIPQLADALKMTIEVARLAGQLEADDYTAAIDRLHSVLTDFLVGFG